MVSQTYVEALRHAEFEAVQAWFSPGMQVLEVGGGNGYQAGLIAEIGCEVISIDVADRSSGPSYHPVVEYDGEVFPVADAEIDRVFSSNVLEHVRDLGAMFREIQRVLRTDGLAVHVVPSSTWRFWMTVAFYPFALKAVVTRAYRPVTVAKDASHFSLLKRALLFPLKAHGEYRNSLAELFQFSRGKWERVFEENGFAVIEARGSGLFYTGHGLLPRLPIRVRRATRRLLGSSTHIFVLRLR